MVNYSRRSMRAMPFLAVGLLCVLSSACSVPEVARDRWGWAGESSSDKSTYERSLSYDACEREGLDPRSDWRILNHMMYYLLRERAKAAGVGSDEDGEVQRLQNYHYFRDSASVDSLYDRAFLSLDRSAHIHDGNAFVDSLLLRQRLPQVTGLRGFDQAYGLSDWGKIITRVGPMSDVWLSSTIVIGTGTDGVTYRAIKNSFAVYSIIEAADDGVSMLSCAGTLRRQPESQKLVLTSENSLTFPIDYAEAEVREIKVVKLPCPQSGLWLDAGKRFFEEEWDGDRLVVDIAAETDDFSISVGGRRMVALSVAYRISGTSPHTELVDSIHFQHDITEDPGRGFVARFVSAPFPRTGECRFELAISSGSETRMFRKVLSDRSKSVPLTLVRSKDSAETRIPGFAVGPVRRGDTVAVFFPIEVLPANDNHYGCTAVVAMFAPKSRDGIVSFGDSLLVSWDDDGRSESVVTIEQAIASWGEKFCCRWDVHESHPRGYFTRRAAIPRNAEIGRNLLIAEFYVITDPESGAVRRIAEGQVSVQVE